MTGSLTEWSPSFGPTSASALTRTVTTSADGQDGDPMDATAGLPQGPPIAPVLFAIYITDIHEAAENQAEDSRGIPFVGDVTWVVEGNDLDDVVRKLEQFAAASFQWADDNAVRFETSKTEAIIFSRRRRHRRCERGIRMGGQTSAHRQPVQVPPAAARNL